MPVTDITAEPARRANLLLIEGCAVPAGTKLIGQRPQAAIPNRLRAALRLHLVGPSLQVGSGSRQAQTSRVFGLDLLRAISILMIVYIHAMGVVSGIVDKRIYLFPATDSVSMFFVLSGYLIGRILIKTFVERTGDTASLGQFWMYRWFRTLPNYYLVLAILVVVSSLNGSGSDSPVGPFFIFSQNIAWKHPSFFGEAWSLAVEEWFYLLMPLLVIGMMWRSASVAVRKRRLVILLAVVSLASIVARLPAGLSGHIVTYDDWDSLVRKVVVGRFDALAIGVFGAYLSIYRTALWTRNTRILAIIGVLLIVLDRHVFSRNEPYAIYCSLTVLPLSTLLMMPYLSQLSCRRNLITDTVEWISRRSYSMYLVNLSLTYLILSYLPFEWAGSQAIAVEYLTYWVIVFGISAGLYQLWEMPMMNLRTRFRWSTPVEAYGGHATSAAVQTADAGDTLSAALQRTG